MHVCEIELKLARVSVGSLFRCVRVSVYIYVEELYVRSSCVWESDRLFTTLIPFIKPLGPGQASEKRSQL